MVYSGVPDRVQSASSRLVFGSWLITCLVMNALYTANLVASLTFTPVNIPFDTLREMVQQTEYEYDVATGEVLEVLFQVSLLVLLGCQISVK